MLRRFFILHNKMSEDKPSRGGMTAPGEQQGLRLLPPCSTIFSMFLPPPLSANDVVSLITDSTVRERRLSC